MSEANLNINRLSELLQETAEISITDLFEIEELQTLQDAFAQANHVGSLITRPDGTPITRPSNFCRLCRDVVRATEKGLANCIRSDSIIGRQRPDGPHDSAMFERRWAPLRPGPRRTFPDLQGGGILNRNNGEFSS
jgi:hypothetical protein